MTKIYDLPNDLKNLTYTDLKTDKRIFKDQLNEEEFRSDLNLLRFAILKAYGARGTLSEEIFGDVDKALSNLNCIKDTKHFCVALGEILSKFPDYHLQVRLNNEVCFKRNIKKINVGKNLNDTNSHWKGIIDKDSYIIAITSFPSGEWPEFSNFISKAIKSAKRIIIDLRGNGGGDDSIAFRMAEQIAGQKIQTPFSSDIKRNTPETLTIWENNLILLKEYFNDPNATKQIDQYLEENKSNLKSALNGSLEEFTEGEISENRDWTYDISKGFKGNIYILQDKETGSSGESTINFFEYFPKVTKIGYNTIGMIHFGNIGRLTLKHSGISLNIPTKANRYKDGRFIEYTGIKPDITLKDGEDAYKYLVETYVTNE